MVVSFEHERPFLKLVFSLRVTCLYNDVFELTANVHTLSPMLGEHSPFRHVAALMTVYIGYANVLAAIASVQLTQARYHVIARLDVEN